jgi:DNA polymerase elongation subunit (family B)
METSFKKLTLKDKDHIIDRYGDHDLGKDSMENIQLELAELYGVTTRTIRNWANNLGLNILIKDIENPFKVLVYDIETSRAPAMVFSTGKTYITHKQLREEFKIISISYKWLGQDEVFSLTWDKNHSDEKMVKDFLVIYNQADMLIGFNNDKFDNRWINARAAKYGLEVNTQVKSFDLYKQAKKLYYLPSYSMAYISKYFGVTQKQNHEGVIMWDKIQFGTPAEQVEYLGKMVDYNVGDIITTEEIYLDQRKYMGHKVHMGVILGKDKYSCPNCGGENIKEYNGNFTVTPAGTIQRHMICNEDRVQFKMSNTTFLKNKQ